MIPLVHACNAMHAKIDSKNYIARVCEAPRQARRMQHNGKAAAKVSRCTKACKARVSCDGSVEKRENLLYYSESVKSLLRQLLSAEAP